MNPTKNDLPLDVRQRLVEALNFRLADAIDLTLQTKQAHWNVRGPQFIALHELFDKVHAAVAEFVDEIAERIVALGGTAEGTLQSVQARSGLPAYRLDLRDGGGHVDALSTAVAGFVSRVRPDIDTSADLGDAVTSDLLTGIARETDKLLWFIEAHHPA
jgi:starvation-inducible DNA-binding protein